MDKMKMSQVTFLMSIGVVILSAAVSVFKLELWLAGTQWMLVAIVLAIWAIFLKK